MKPRKGSVKYDDRYRRYVAKISATHPITKIEREWKRHCETSREAHVKLKEIQAAAEEWVQAEAPGSMDPFKMTFDDLAIIFEKKSLIPAEYLNGVKVAGRRSLKAPIGWLANFREFFGKKKLRQIRYSDLEDFKLSLIRKPTGQGTKQRAVASVNRELQFCKTIFAFAVTEGYLKTNPFLTGKRKLVDSRGETKRNRLPGFGEELAILRSCVNDLDFLALPLIVAADTGLRYNEMVTLEIRDLDFKHGVIHVRKENAKNNRDRDIPMTARVREALTERGKGKPSSLLFHDLPPLRYYWENAKRQAAVTNLTWHDLRHAFVSRSILAGIPPAVVLKASGHASDEWKRYLNTTPDQLRGLLAPLDGQTADEVRRYAATVMKGLRDAMRYDEIEKIFEALEG